MLKITPRKMIKCCIYMADDPYYQLIITLENIYISVALFKALYTCTFPNM